MKSQPVKHKRSISQLFQDSQKNTNTFVKMVGHAMMHVLGGNKPPKEIYDELSLGISDFRHSKMLKEDSILVREIERKMNLRIEEYLRYLERKV